MNAGNQTYFGLADCEFHTPRFDVVHLQLDNQVHAPPHFHERTHLCLVVQGCYCEKIGRRQFERKTSDVMFHPSGVPHSGSNLHGTRCLVIEFNDDDFLKSQISSSRFSHPCHFRNSEVNMLADKLQQEINQPQLCSELAIESLVLEMLVFVARRSKSNEFSRPPTWLIDLKDRIRSEYLTLPSFACLAKTVGRDPSHVARVFRQHFGMSTGEYVRQLKVELAKTQLSDSDTPIGIIAKECGFSDSAHLARVFRRLTGMTPRRFRFQSLLRSNPRISQNPNSNPMD